MAKDETNEVPANVALAFLTEILPFKDLDPAALSKLARRCTIDFYPKGTLIFRQGETEVSHLYVIQQGGIKTYRTEGDTQTLKDYRGVGEYFGALPLIQGTRANLNIETIDDTFCFLFEKQDFLDLLDSNPAVSQYYLRTMSAKMAGLVYSEVRQHKMAPRTDGALYLFSAQVGDVAKGNLYQAPESTTVQEAAIIMSENMIGSLLLTDSRGEISGIVTDKDIRSKVVAKGIDFKTPVSAIMASPVQTISSQAVCFDALLKMIKTKIHHLAIEQNGKIIRMITTHDIMVTQGTSPLYLFREILAQKKIEGLYPLARKIPQVVRSLIEEGAKANNITRMIAVLNDHVLDRMLSLLQEEFGRAPVPWAWLLLGSEGRREQTFKTDQDNAIIYGAPEDPTLKDQAEEYFRPFSERAIEHLVKCGYPLCPGNIMASNPELRQPFPVWSGYFQKWCRTPTPESVLKSMIFFDFKAGFGDNGMAEALRDEITRTARKSDIFQLWLAKSCLSSRPPLSFFKNFIVEKDGEHKNTFDLKTRGLVFIVDFARLMSLKHGITETNTLARLNLLQENQYLPQGLCNEIIEAYEFLMHLRLIHQLQMMETGQEPDNYINPKDLTDLERQTLKEAFAVIGRLQDFLSKEFHLAEQ
ncbi:MAG: cyclic nucleotide-binding domain-containing protein [Proteobacteria bacterium]|nr:cyclic nucleotide-binding domain-containing protein [Pseudomonadota bacterium]MBU1737577.1 cyclic nucleotide-binding domain-containing protein [Pseudomonadota bacterium]